MKTLMILGLAGTLALHSWGATMNFAITNSDTTPYTGPLMIYPVGPGATTRPISADGSFLIGRVLQRVELTNALGSAQLMRGTYFASNNAVAFCFAVPLDTGNYNAASNMISGYNLFQYVPGVSSDMASNMITAMIGRAAHGRTNWPAADAPGVLTDDGAGNLSWAGISSGDYNFSGRHNAMVIGYLNQTILSSGSDAISLGFGGMNLETNLGTLVLVGDGMEAATNVQDVVCIGHNALNSALRPSQVVAIGMSAGNIATNVFDSVLIGVGAGQNASDSELNDCVFIGLGAGADNSDSANDIAIGTNARTSIANQVALGNSLIEEVYTAGAYKGLGYIISGTENQITFGSTNTAPLDAVHPVWISVSVTGDTNEWRLPLYR